MHTHTCFPFSYPDFFLLLTVRERWQQPKPGDLLSLSLCVHVLLLIYAKIGMGTRTALLGAKLKFYP